MQIQYDPKLLNLVDVTMGDLWSEVPGIRWTLAGLSASLVDIAIALVAFAILVDGYLFYLTT